MTGGAGVRCAELEGQIGPGYAQAVIGALVHDHVNALGHMTGHAGCAGRAGRVVMVLGCIVTGSGMAASADGVALGEQLKAVGLVAVAADDPLMVHAALDEGAVDEDLVLDLPVREVERGIQQGEAETLMQGFARGQLILDASASGMTAGAGLGLHMGAALGRAGHGSLWFPRRGIDLPDTAVAILQVDQQTPTGGIGRRSHVRTLSGRLRPRPVDMTATRSVTGLAGDVDLRIAGVVDLLLGVVALVQVGGVAVRALIVPGLLRGGPMQRVAVVHRRARIRIRIKMEPALTALLRRARVPGQAEGLEPTAGKRDQILLQRRPAEGVADRIVPQLPVGPVGLHEEGVVSTEEAGCDAVRLDLRVVEVAEHGLRRGLRHRQVVVGALPKVKLRLVALCADRGADIAALRTLGVQMRIRQPGCSRLHGHIRGLSQGHHQEGKAEGAQVHEWKLLGRKQERPMVYRPGSRLPRPTQDVPAESLRRLPSSPRPCV